MKHHIRIFLSVLLTLTLFCGLSPVTLAIEDAAVLTVGADNAVTDEPVADATATDATATDATATDATATDATATDATETDAPDCSTQGHRYAFVQQKVDPVMREVVVIVECAVCGERKEIPLSEYNKTFADGEKARADGAYIVIREGVTAKDVLAGCPEDTAVLDADGKLIPADKTPGSGAQVLFPSSRAYTVILYGDADGDAQISPADARIALRIAVGLAEHLDWRDKACHVIDNGKRAVLPADARLILRASVGLENAAEFGSIRDAADATATDATPTDATATDATATDATPTDATPTDATPTDATATDATATDAEPAYRPGAYRCIWKGGVYLREDHSFEAAALCVIPYETAVTVTEVCSDDGSGKKVWWGRISYGDKTGWSVLDYYQAAE